MCGCLVRHVARVFSACNVEVSADGWLAGWRYQVLCRLTKAGCLSAVHNPGADGTVAAVIVGPEELVLT